MSDRELRDFSPKMREIMGSISAADVAHHPAVVAATAEVAAARADHAIYVGRANESETNIRAVDLLINEVTQQIDQIDGKEGTRVVLALEIFRGIRGDSDDVTMHAELQDLRRRRGQLELVRTSFSEQHERALRELSRPSRATTMGDAISKLDEMVFRARHEAAKEIDTHYHGNVETWRQKRASSERSAREVA
jgi:hypothetical protein